MNDDKADFGELRNDGSEWGQEPAGARVSEIEKVIRNLWSEILDIDGIAPHDDFLDLGGNSVQAMQIISRMNLEFDVEIPLHVLFDGVTPADLALAIGENADHDSDGM